MSQKIILVLTIAGFVIIQFYQFQQLYYHNDELYSAYFYVDKGFLYTLTNYQHPNNHIFFNLLACSLNELIAQSALSMRIVSIVSEIFFITILFVYLYSQKGFTTAIVTISFCLCSISHGAFALSGRGYMLESLLTLISVLSLLNQSNNNHSFYLFILCSALAIFTVPSHIFIVIGVLSASFFILKDNIYNKISYIFKCFACTLVLAILLYGPVIILNGYNSIINNTWVQPYHMDIIVFVKKIMLPSWLESCQFIFGIFWIKGSVLSFILLAIMLLGYNSKSIIAKQLITILGCCFVSLILLSIYINRFPPYRTLVPFVGLFFMIGGILISSNIKIAIPILLVMVAYNVYFFPVNTLNKEAVALEQFSKIIHFKCKNVYIYENCFAIKYYLSKYDDLNLLLGSSPENYKWVVCSQNDLKKINRSQYQIEAVIDYDYILLQKIQ